MTDLATPFPEYGLSGIKATARICIAVPFANTACVRCTGAVLWGGLLLHETILIVLEQNKILNE